MMATIEIQTSRFGVVRCQSEDLIHFPEGILGFSDLRQFVLLDDPNDEIFAWLQSCSVPQIAFPVLEPELFSQNYQMNLTRHDLESLDMREYLQGLHSQIQVATAKLAAVEAPLKDAANTKRAEPIPGLRAFSIITIPDDPTQMTANLKAPIVINVAKRMAKQIVLQDNNLAIREPIFQKLQMRVVQNPQAPIKTQAADWGVAVRLPSQGPEASV